MLKSSTLLKKGDLFLLWHVHSRRKSPWGHVSMSGLVHMPSRSRCYSPALALLLLGPRVQAASLDFCPSYQRVCGFFLGKVDTMSQRW
jgi:hypothetical protein